MHPSTQEVVKGRVHACGDGGILIHIEPGQFTLPLAGQPVEVCWNVEETPTPEVIT